MNRSRDGNTLVCMCAALLQSCPTLCNRTDHIAPASSVHGILQARTLAWAAMLSSRRSSWPRDWQCLLHWQSCTLPLVPPGKHKIKFWSLLSKCIGYNYENIIKIGETQIVNGINYSFIFMDWSIHPPLFY